MKYIVETKKDLEQACSDLGSSVVKHGFGVLHIHDLYATLNKKGVPFQNPCRVFEVCNPGKAQAVMTYDMTLRAQSKIISHFPLSVTVYIESRG